MSIDFNNIESIIGGFSTILKLQSSGKPIPIPVPLILTGIPQRSGLSPIKIASRIISRKSEAGIPVGLLPSGAVNPDEMMWRIAIEEIIRALQEDAVISVAIPPGITINATGMSPAGAVTVVGATVVYSKGYGIIQ